MRIANGSSLDTNTPAFQQAISACKDLEPAGFTGSKRSPQQQAAALKFAQCIRANGVQRLPGPHPRRAPRRHESNPIRRNEQWYEHSQRRDAEVPRSAAARSWESRASEAEDVGAGRSGRPGCRDRHRRRGRHVRREASGPGRTAAAGEHREGGKEDALGHGLPGRDPDLSGAIGRLAVLGDQPGPRDIHRAARGSAR